ncbi:MAG: SBBP repeat-containing protein [Desulfobulbaceae bacterium]
MTRSDWGRIRLRSINSLLMMLLLLAGVWLIPASPAQAGLPDAPPDLLQRTTAGHVLGFQPDSLAVVGGNHAYRVEFAGAAPVAPVADASASAQGKSGSLGRVSYPGLWPGITLFYDKTNGGILRSTYLLQPGADPAHIRLRYNAPVHLEPDGSLRIEYATGLMRESAPAAWQDIDGRRVPVAVAFRLAENPTAGPEVGFSLGAYNPAHPLTIDPVLQWNTFLGGSGNDTATAIALDGNGNVYLTGISSVSWGSTPKRHFTEGETGEESDAYAARLNGTGELMWHTFLGGTGDDVGTGIAVDAAGNVYVTGISNATWGNNPLNEFITEVPATDDVFAAKLASDGTLEWNTFMGSTGDDRGFAVTVKGNAVYVAGGSANTWGETLTVDQHGGGLPDGFVARLNSADGALQWNTFTGAACPPGGCADSDQCAAYAIAVDKNDNVVVVGDSTVPFNWGSSDPIRDHSGNFDVFAVKLGNNGNRGWHTFLGGPDIDHSFGALAFGSSVAVDDSGNIYVGGDSSAGWGSPLRAHAGSDDVFAAKLNDGGNIVWHTFLGGPGIDWNSGVAMDDSGNLYVTGISSAAWGSPLNNFIGEVDGFVAKLDNSGILQKNTFVGGAGEDFSNAVAVAEEDFVHLAGNSTAAWGNPIRPHQGGLDAFVAKLHLYKFPWTMFLPSITDGATPQAYWGVENQVCCQTSPLTFYATLAGVTKSSTVSSCTASPTWEGWAATTPGAKTFTGGISSSGCGSGSESLQYTLREGMYHLFKLELSGTDLIVTVYIATPESVTNAVAGTSGFVLNEWNSDTWTRVEEIVLDISTQPAALLKGVLKSTN